MSAKENLEAREKLESQEFWIPQAGRHKAWLKALCTALLDSGGVKSEALLLSRPLCLVSSWTSLRDCLLILLHHILQVSQMRLNPSFNLHIILQVKVDCCQRLLPLIIHSILLDDSDGSWRELLSSHIQDFFSFCCRSAQACSRAATPLNSDSGRFETMAPYNYNT